MILPKSKNWIERDHKVYKGTRVRMLMNQLCLLASCKIVCECDVNDKERPGVNNNAENKSYLDALRVAGAQWRVVLTRKYVVSN